MIRQIIKLFIFAMVFIPITKATDTEENYEFNRNGYNKFAEAKGHDWVAYLQHQKQTMTNSQDLAKLAMVIQYGDYIDNGEKLFGWTSFTKATPSQAKALTSLYLNTAILADCEYLSEIKEEQEKPPLFNNQSLEEKFKILIATHPYILQQNLFKKLDITYKTVNNSDGTKSTNKIIDNLFEDELNLSLEQMQKQIVEINAKKLSMDTHNNRCEINTAQRLEALSQLLSSTNINEIEDVEATFDIILTIAGKPISQNKELEKYKKQADEMYKKKQELDKAGKYSYDSIAPLSKSGFVFNATEKPKNFLNYILLFGLHPNTYRIEFNDIAEDTSLEYIHLSENHLLHIGSESCLSKISPFYPDLKEITMQNKGQITQATFDAILAMKNLELFHFSPNVIKGKNKAKKLLILKNFLKTITNQSEYPNMKDIYVDQLDKQLLTNNNGTREEMDNLQAYIDSLSESIFN
jgi:hypothetical protein